jgi:lipopolysaccharide transport system permease protein
MSSASTPARIEDIPLPAEPVVRIRPVKGWIGLDLRELWRYRELFGFLVWRDIKIKYKQSLLGVGWAIMLPFMQMVIFATVFGGVANLPSDGLPSSLFYFAALLPWTYFATAVSMSSNSLVGSANMITKIYFPRIIMPASPCIAGLVDFAIAFMLLLAMILGAPLLYDLTIPLSWTALLLPLLMLTAFGCALGVGLILSAMNVKYRDIKYIVPFLIQMWMFATVLVPFSMISAEKYGTWRYLYALNPMVGVTEAFRWCLFHNVMTVDGGPVPAPWTLLAIGTPVMLMILTFGLFYFRRMEKMFADVV